MSLYKERDGDVITSIRTLVIWLLAFVLLAGITAFVTYELFCFM